LGRPKFGFKRGHDRWGADVPYERGQADEVTSVDIDPRAGADICEDVMAWDFRKYPRGYFELIVASPPWIEHRRSKTTGASDRKGADALLGPLEMVARKSTMRTPPQEGIHEGYSVCGRGLLQILTGGVHEANKCPCERVGTSIV